MPDPNNHPSQNISQKLIISSITMLESTWLRKEWDREPDTIGEILPIIKQAIREVLREEREREEIRRDYRRLTAGSCHKRQQGLYGQEW